MKYLPLIVILATLTVLAPISVGQSPANKELNGGANKSDSTTQSIMQLENNLNEAILKGDPVVLDKLLAEDWFAKISDTSVITKPQLMAYVKSNGTPWASIKDEDVVVRIYDSAAVVDGRSIRGLKGSESVIRYRFTRVYAKTPTGWQLVAMHAERVAQ